jgi:NADH-quinone oxidoreductase subunit L
MVSNLLIPALIPLLPLLGFAVIALNAKRIPKGLAATIACGAVFISFILSVILFIQLLNAPGTAIEVTAFEWIMVGDFSAAISFLVDPLSSLFMLIITGVGFLIHVYSAGYMHDDEGVNRFFSYLNLFIFFMLLLVMGANYLLMFVGWEGVGLCSYLLIGFWFQNQDYNSAANKAFIMNRIGDLGMLLAIILIFANFGSIQYGEVFSKAGDVSGSTITWITMLLFVGAMGKSAQLPLYTWLPDAMAGPTPVSALIHAATMVTAGIYMVARNNLLYSLSPATLGLITIIGLATAIFAATIAVAQNDIKKVLAYSTVSQLGLMFLALGLGSYVSGIFHVATHAFFKALLFLAAGSVIHALSGEQDLRHMGGLRKHLPITFFVFLVGVLAISGIPPFAGFFSKDEILAKAFEHNIILWVLAVIMSLLTVFYMFRLLFLTFFGNTRAGNEVMAHIHESPKSMTIPLMALAFLSIVGGFMGIPEVLGGSHWLSEFLSPVFAASAPHLEGEALSHSTEYILMGLVIGLTLVVIYIAYNTYVKKNSTPVADSQLTGFNKTLSNKYYVDELYDSIVVRPLYGISALFEKVIEISGIEALVNSISKGLTAASRGARLLQDGSIGYYIFIMVISIVLILTFSVNW